MKLFKYLLAAMMLLAFAACSDDDGPVLPPEDENIAPQFDTRFAAKLLVEGYISNMHHITRAEVEGIKRLDVRSSEDYRDGNGLKSLKGIEYFTSLTVLNCSFNNIESLDVSHNTALTHIDCTGNRLSALDVSHNTALESFLCNKNPGRNGIFEVTLWPGSELATWNDSWEYDGQTVTVNYVENEE